MRTVVQILIPAITFFLLAAVGMDLTGDDFARVRRRPAVVLTGLLAPLVVLPPLALALIWLWQPPPSVAAGLLLVAACPIGGISNAYSYLARASTALSVTLTGLSCLLASVTVPAVGHAIALALDQPWDLVAPIPLLFTQLVLMLGVPVALGMSVRRRSPLTADKYRPALHRLAVAFLVLLIVLIVADDPRAFAASLPGTVPLAAAFVAASMVLGWLAGAVVTADRRDRFTLAAEFGTRNVAVAMAIAVALLGRVEFAVFATTYFLTELPLMAIAIAWFRATEGTRRPARS